MEASSRVALNTGILYIRMLITIGISLFAVRLVLKELGNIDFGILNLVAGVVVFLSFLSTAMATSTQRYLSFYQGQSDLKMQRTVFSNSLLLHMLLGLLIVLLLFLLEDLIFRNFFNIPSERQAAAEVIYHYMAFTAFFTIASVPFNGVLIARENMFWVAIINIVEAFLRLGIALAIHYFRVADKLIFYGQLMLLTAIIVFVLYAVFCYLKYDECRLNLVPWLDKGMCKQLGAFAGWNMFGSLCGVGRNQGLAFILNYYNGVSLNTAYAIGNQVGYQLNFLSATLLRALNPQIMKSEGAGDRERVIRLSLMASKFGFFLSVILAVPCFFEMDHLLEFWLGVVPPYTSIFCSLIIASILVNQLTIGLQSAIQAVGQINVYQVVVGLVLLLNIPLAIIALSLHYNPSSVLWIAIMVELLACVLRVYFAKRIVGMQLSEYLNRVLLKEILPLICIVLVSYLITRLFHFHLRFLLTFFIAGMAFLGSAYFFGLCTDEKELVKKNWTKLYSRFRLSQV